MGRHPGQPPSARDRQIDGHPGRPTRLSGEIPRYDDARAGRRRFVQLPAWTKYAEVSPIPALLFGQTAFCPGWKLDKGDRARLSGISARWPATRPGRRLAALPPRRAKSPTVGTMDARRTTHSTHDGCARRARDGRAHGRRVPHPRGGQASAAMGAPCSTCPPHPRALPCFEFRPLHPESAVSGPVSGSGGRVLGVSGVLSLFGIRTRLRPRGTVGTPCPLWTYGVCAHLRR